MKAIHAWKIIPELVININYAHLKSARLNFANVVNGSKYLKKASLTKV